MVSGKRRFRRSKKRSAGGKGSGSLSIRKLATKVNRIARSIKAGTDTIYLQNSIAYTSLTQPFFQWNMLNYNNCRAVFGTDTTEYGYCQQWKHVSTVLDYVIFNNNEMSNIDMKLFIVSLKKEASSKLNFGTGVLTLTEGDDYVRNNSITTYGQGWSFLNPRVFNIHYEKKLIIGNNGVASYGATGTGNSSVRGTYRAGKNVHMNMTVKNPHAAVSSLITSYDPAQCYFMLLFNDNSALDGENPQITINAVHKIIVPT